jgi:hypothetical protein
MGYKPTSAALSDATGLASRNKYGIDGRETGQGCVHDFVVSLRGGKGGSTPIRRFVFLSLTRTRWGGRFAPKRVFTKRLKMYE